MTHTAVLTIRHDLLSYCTVSYVSFVFYFFFFNDTATTEIYTLSLHDALPISNEPPDPGSAAPSSLQTIPSHTTTTSATSQPSIAWGPPSADMRSGIVMNGPIPIMFVILSAVA